jgi:hypothetical protein
LLCVVCCLLLLLLLLWLYVFFRTISVQFRTPFTLRTPFQGNCVGFLIALSNIGVLWQCFGGGWGPPQNPKHGLRTVMDPLEMGPVSDFVEAPLFFNPCLGFFRGPHPPPKHPNSIL